MAHSKVDAFLARAPRWREEMTRLRELVARTGLTEELKWGKPCYSHRGGNVVILAAFKAHCALLFAKGALLRDPEGLLIQPTENTQATRQMRFTSVGEIAARESALEGFLRQAMEVEEAGLEVEYRKEFPHPEELQEAFEARPALREAFLALTPGRQRGYVLYFAGAKQAKTRQARVEKCAPRILEGKGLDD